MIEKENQQISRNNGYVICMLKNFVKNMHPHYCNKSQTNKQININT